jgi:hypothetical protein
MSKDKFPAFQMVKGNGFPLTRQRILPNDPCRCGSGKKAKKCCGTKTDFHYTRLNEKQVKEREEAEAKKELAAID